MHYYDTTELLLPVREPGQQLPQSFYKFYYQLMYDWEKNVNGQSQTESRTGSRSSNKNSKKVNNRRKSVGAGSFQSQTSPDLNTIPSAFVNKTVEEIENVLHGEFFLQTDE